MNIEVRGLKKVYGQHIVLNHFDFNAVSGKLYCLYGPSGSGKTTLINIIGQLEPYDQGELLYDGQSIQSSKQRIMFHRSKCGFIFQDFGLMENETVFTNLNIVYQLRKKKDRRALMIKALHKVGLDHVVDRYVYELSGGEQQRVAFARLLLKDSELVLADEPTANLDTANKNVILSLLEQLAQQGRCVIVASHDEAVMQMADERKYVGLHE